MFPAGTIVTNHTNTRSASSVAVTAGEDFVGDVDFDRDMVLSFSLHNGVFR